MAAERTEDDEKIKIYKMLRYKQWKLYGQMDYRFQKSVILNSHDFHIHRQPKPILGFLSKTSSVLPHPINPNEGAENWSKTLPNWNLMPVPNFYIIPQYLTSKTSMGKNKFLRP